MSEYITIETEPTGEPDVMRVLTNLNLTTGGEVEAYASPLAGEEGSPLAQELYGINGLLALRLAGDEMLVTRTPDTEWHALIDDIRAVLVDFFL